MRKLNLIVVFNQNLDEAMIYFFEKNINYGFMIFGQLFLVFGILALKNNKGKDKLISLPFIAVGICCVVIPYLMMNPNLIERNNLG